MITDTNLNLYKIFYVCAKSKSFVDAANKLYITQPSVSLHIKNLEEILGTKLFFRNTDGLKLTSDGEELLEYVEKGYNSLLTGEKVIRENNDINFGTIVIGVPGYIASFYLLRFVEKYRKKYPNVKFVFINESTDVLLEQLKNQKIDFILDSSPIEITDNRMTIKPLEQYETCFITYPGNEKLNFKKQKYIMPYERSAIRKSLERELSSQDIKLDVILEVETTDLIISSVKHKVGSGYVVKEAVKEELKNNSIIELESSVPLPKLEINLVYIDQYLTKLAKNFIKDYIK